MFCFGALDLMQRAQERDGVERQVEELRSICAAKVRAAEAKWEEAIAVIDRLTAQKMISPSSSSSSQTDDFGATPPLPTQIICDI